MNTGILFIKVKNKASGMPVLQNVHQIIKIQDDGGHALIITANPGEQYGSSYVTLEKFTAIMTLLQGFTGTPS